MDIYFVNSDCGSFIQKLTIVFWLVLGMIFGQDDSWNDVSEWTIEADENVKD